MIERHLRNGVMTEVYRARREGSGRDRFEVRRFTLVASSEALRAVRRELDRIQALRMPAIPALVDVIDDPVGLLVVTETVAEGATSLRMTLDAAGPLEVADCTRIVRVVAGVLDVLHGATPQVLHRRLSPDTITLIGPQREVRVEECGLAQALVDAGLVNARVPLQARQYLSPDELLQRPSPRGDLFALASVAFECLTGRPAFLGATEASLSAAILRGVRPSVNALRPEVPAAVDVVLARAWSADASKGFASAAALADALSTALGIPGSGARPPLRVEPPHGSPPAGAPVLSPGELSIMKATILGVGTPSKPPAAPRAKPNEAERHALLEPAPMAPTRSRLVGGRPQMPTQKVEVPRIHPPGTERVGEEGERPTFPPARLPPAPPIPSAAPSDRPANSDLFNIADIEGLDIPLSPEKFPSVAPPAPRSPSMPPPIPKVPSRSPTILRSSVPPPGAAPLLVPEPESPSTEVTFEMDAEIPASVVDDLAGDTWESPSPTAPSRPPSMPALPRVTATEAPVSPVVPESSDESEPAPELSLDSSPPVEAAPEAEPDVEPSIPSFPIPPEPTPAPGWSFPPMSEPPAPPALFEHAAPQPPPPSVPLHAPGPTAPPSVPVSYPDAGVAEAGAPPPSNLAKWKIMGASLVAAAAIVTGGQIYLAKLRQTSEVPRQVPAVVLPSPAPLAPVVAPPTVVDASVVAAADVAAAATADAATAAVTSADAATAAATDAATGDVGAVRPALVVDASAPAPTGEAAWDVAVFGASNDPPREHPRRRDMDDLEAALEPGVRRCVGPSSSRHVRMSVVYEGATGRPRSLRIVGSYAQPPVGTCLEALVRAHPVPPFTDDAFEANYVFSTSDEED